MPLSAQVLLSMVAHESSSGDLSKQMRVTPATYAVAFSDGTGANQAQVAWSGARTIGVSESDDLVLTALADDRGAVSFSSIKALYIKNTSATDISLGRDQQGDEMPSSPWDGTPMSSTSGYALPGGASICVCNPSAAGIAVFSGNKLRVSGGSGSTYEIALIGEGTIS
jgi:hypothetical protein